MTFEEENEYLYIQYVLTLKNDGGWYRATRQAVAAHHFGEYAQATWSYLTRLMSDNGDCSTRSMKAANGALRFIEYLMRRVALICWHEEESFDANKSKEYGAYRECLSCLTKAWLLPPVCYLGPSTANAEPEQPTNLEPESEIMNPDAIKSIAPAFVTQHLIYGQNVTNMSDAALITAIKQVEREIADLKAVATTSTKITAMAEALTSMLAQIVKTLDAR